MRKATLFAATLIVAYGSFASADRVSRSEAVSNLNTTLAEMYPSVSVEPGHSRVTRGTADAVRLLAGIEPLSDDARHNVRDTYSVLTSYLYDEGYEEVKRGARHLDASARLAIMQWVKNRRVVAEAELIPSDRPPVRLTIAGQDNARDAFIRATGDDSVSGVSLDARDIVFGGGKESNRKRD